MHRRTAALSLAVALTATSCGSADDPMADTSAVTEAAGGEVMVDDGDMDHALRDEAFSPAGGTTGGSTASTQSGTTSSSSSLTATADAVAPLEAAPGSSVAEPPPGSTDGREVLAASSGVNPFVSTLEDAESTFAMDVDQASWSLSRSWIEAGRLPPVGAVRVEEFVNAFDHDYPTPDKGWSITADTVGTPWNPTTRLVRVGLATPTLDPDERPEATLTFVVDTSGSMSGRPLQTVKDTLLTLVDQLRPTDRIGLVEYGTDARLILEPTPLAESDTVTNAIQSLESNGVTFAEAGIALGYEVAVRNLTPDGAHLVVLASDGVANVGATGPDAILERVAVGVDEGIHMLALGVGDGLYNDFLMEQLSNRGNGATYYVQDSRDAERIFVDNLESSLVVAAVDSKVQVVFDPDVVAEYRLLGYENRDVADEDFRNDDVDAGEVGAGHQVTAVYEVVPTGESDPLGRVFVRWEDPDTGEVAEVDAPLAAAPGAADGGIGTALAAVTLAEILRESPHIGDYGIEDLADLVGSLDVDPALADVIERARSAR